MSAGLQINKRQGKNGPPAWSVGNFHQYENHLLKGKGITNGLGAQCSSQSLKELARERTKNKQSKQSKVVLVVQDDGLDYVSTFPEHL